VNYYIIFRKKLIAISHLTRNKKTREDMATSERTVRISFSVLTDSDTDNASECRKAIQQRRQTFPYLQSHDLNDSRSPLKLLYNITDIVLCMCAITFIVSTIAYSTLWILGCALAL
jgi:hypothetical protein